MLLCFVTGFSLVGCGGGMAETPAGPSVVRAGQTGSDSNNAATGGTNMVINVGGYTRVPDQIVSLHVNIDYVKLHPSQQTDITLLTNPRRLELSQKKVEPLLLGQVPSAKYSGVTVGLSGLVISYIDSTGVLHENVAATLTSSSATNPSEGQQRRHRHSAAQFQHRGLKGEVEINAGV